MDRGPHLSLDGGVGYLDQNREKFHRYPVGKEGLSYSYVSEITEDRSGHIWISTLRGLNRFDKSSQSFTHYFATPGDPNSFISNQFWTVFVDEVNAIWLSTSTTGLAGSGINRFDPASGHIQRFVHNDKNPNSIHSNTIYHIIQDKESNIWMATGNGISIQKKSSALSIPLGKMKY